MFGECRSVIACDAGEEEGGSMLWCEWSVAAVSGWLQAGSNRYRGLGGGILEGEFVRILEREFVRILPLVFSAIVSENKPPCVGIGTTVHPKCYPKYAATPNVTPDVTPNVTPNVQGPHTFSF